jgi:hypothetical protein
MARFHAALDEGVEAGSASSRVGSYPIRAVLSLSRTPRKGIDNQPRLARQDRFSDSCPTAAIHRITSL